MSKPYEKLTYRALERASRLASRTADSLHTVSDRYANKVSDSAPLDKPMQDIVWFHSIELADGTVTPGVKPRETLANEELALNLPTNLKGHSALDIGAWDGSFSFELERRGAGPVVSLDHYAWSTDQAAYQKYLRESVAAGKVPVPPDVAPGTWDPVGLPGRAGFEYARKNLGSGVRPVVGDFMTMDLRALGRFDIVLFLGVLYHLRDPFLALRRLRAVTKGTAVIETAGINIPGAFDDKLWMFLETTELNDDPTNWWAPSSAGLVAACRAAGFRDARVILESPEYAPPIGSYDHHYGRITVHAYA
ncbi:class I SAM-dependent methyltransferase [Jatrophihabitans sp. DSM 45814]